MRSTRTRPTLGAAASLAGAGLLAVGGLASEARADTNSLFTLGIGAQYSYLTSSVARRPGAPERQFGVVSRLKFLRFLGAEVTTSFDQDPDSQKNRILSPRYQLGAMLNVVPADAFHVFLVGGLGAQNGGDLFSVHGDTTSLHGGPGLEVFIADHIAVGGDVRFRMPGPSYIQGEVEEQIATQALTPTGTAPEPIEANVGLRAWQANFTVSFYL